MQMSYGCVEGKFRRGNGRTVQGPMAYASVDMGRPEFGAMLGFGRFLGPTVMQAAKVVPRMQVNPLLGCPSR